ncbi:MAG: hypothetical protein U0931_15020 [Vulcanimicrobiota bacterium]
MDYSNIDHQLDPARLFTGLRLGKRSSARYDTEQVYVFNSPGFSNQPLSPVLNSSFATNESIAGAGNIAAVTYYNASDEWIDFQDFTLARVPLLPDHGAPAPAPIWWSRSFLRRWAAQSARACA